MIWGRISLNPTIKIMFRQYYFGIKGVMSVLWGWEMSRAGGLEGWRIRGQVGTIGGLGRADHPCLAARPTKDGRPYP